MDSIGFKLKINITTRLNVVDYPCLDPFLRWLQGRLTDLGTLGKFCIAPEQNKSASGASYISKEDNFLHRIITRKLKSSTKWFQNTAQNTIESSNSILRSAVIVQNRVCKICSYEKKLRTPIFHRRKGLAHLIETE